MSLRAKVSAIVVAAVTSMLLAPAALASSGPVQLTGRQLKAALLPASDFVAGYTASNESDSGRHLEHLTVFSLPSMSCPDFWLFIGVADGFGETAFAGDLVQDKTGTLNPEEQFQQAVYQFSSTRAAASFFDRMKAKYHACRSVSVSVGNGQSLKRTVHSESSLRVGGHQAEQVIEYAAASGTPGPPLTIYLLETLDGSDVYWFSTTPLTPGPPQPTQSSLTLELIARVAALR
jgi:hypothetical protein